MELDWGEVTKIVTAFISIFSFGMVGGAFGGTAMFRLLSERGEKKENPTWEDRRTETSYRFSIAVSMFGDPKSFSPELKAWVMQPLGIYEYQGDAPNASWNEWLANHGFLDE